MGDHVFILAGWLLDGTGRPVQKKVVLELEGGTILSLLPGDREGALPRGYIDLSHCTIIPGLTDCHVHLFMSGTPSPAVRRRQPNAPYHEVEEVIRRNLADHASHGITAVRDGGDHAAHVLRYRKSHPSADSIRVHISSAGRAWHAKGRYGRLIGRPPLGDLTLAQSILKCEEKTDYIKIINSGINSLTSFGLETPPQFDLESLTAAVRAGERLGLRCMVHANGRLPVKLAVEAGCHSIEHGFFMGRDNLMRIAQREATWVPTAFTMAAFAETLEAGSNESKIARRTYEHQVEQIRSAYELGVNLAIGTDAGSLGVHHGKSVSGELRAFADAGIPLEHIIQCAAYNGARLIGWEEGNGVIASGRPANFSAVKGAPADLLQNIETPEAIFLKGKDVKNLFTPRPRS